MADNLLNRPEPPRQRSENALRTWCWRLIGIFAGPLVFLALVEFILRVAGTGYSTRFLVPNTGAVGYTTNLKFGWWFFPPRIARWPSPQVLPTPKSDRTYRVFVLGSSAAYGTPSDQYGFARILQVMLAGRFPRARIEVVNAAMTAINSHAVLPIARDGARMQPDAFILYMGNNEVIGPYGAGSVFGRQLTSIGLIGAHLWLKSTGIAQVLSSLTDWQGNDRGRMRTWEGMAAFMEQSLAAGDPRLQTVYSHYRRNVQDIYRAVRKSGAQFIPCTVAVNLRDCPPFASQHGADLGEADLATFKEHFERGLELLDQHRWLDAAKAFRSCLQIDDRYADAHYFLAKALEGSGQDIGQARDHFVRARDLDTLRYRTDSAINGIIRDEFSAPGLQRCRLVDVEQRLWADAGSPAGLPGDEFFHEHVHFTFVGNYEVAKALFEAIEPLAAQTLKEEPQPAFVLPSPAECRDRLGFTFLEEAFYDKFMLEEMIGQPPFTHRTGHDRLYAAKKAALVAKYSGRFTEEGLKDALARSVGALAADPHDLYLRRGLLNHYLQMKMRDQAIEQMEVLVKAIPSDYFMLAKLAGEYMRKGDEEKATELFKKAVALNPYLFVAQHNLGVLNYRRRVRAQGGTPAIEDEGGDSQPPFWYYFDPEGTRTPAARD